jgi:hypothetical protein
MAIMKFASTKRYDKIHRRMRDTMAGLYQAPDYCHRTNRSYI